MTIQRLTPSASMATALATPMKLSSQPMDDGGSDRRRVRPSRLSRARRRRRTGSRVPRRSPRRKKAGRSRSRPCPTTATAVRPASTHASRAATSGPPDTRAFRGKRASMRVPPPGEVRPRASLRPCRPGHACSPTRRPRRARRCRLRRRPPSTPGFLDPLPSSRGSWWRGRAWRRSAVPPSSRSTPPPRHPRRTATHCRLLGRLPGWPRQQPVSQR